MKNKIKVYLATLLAISAVVVAVRASEGAAWVSSGQGASGCPPGQVTCQTWDEYECDSSPIFQPNCTDGDTKRENVEKGYCSGGSCETGF